MTDQEFCDLWNASASAVAVAAITSQSKQGAIVKASKLRHKAFDFKTMPCHRVIPIEQRFWSYVQKGESCWLWTGSLNKGYGQLATTREGGPILAHVLSYAIHFGPIPEGQFVLHKCDNPPCVRPDHFFLGTKQENTDDMVRKDRGWWQQRIAKTQHRTVMIGGQQVTLAEAELLTGIPATIIRKRLNIGWPEERAISQPVSVAKQRAGKARHAQ